MRIESLVGEANVERIMRLPFPVRIGIDSELADAIDAVLATRPASVGTATGVLTWPNSD